jgi:hypothetical protein
VIPHLIRATFIILAANLVNAFLTGIDKTNIFFILFLRLNVMINLNIIYKVILSLISYIRYIKKKDFYFITICIYYNFYTNVTNVTPYQIYTRYIVVD